MPGRVGILIGSLECGGAQQMAVRLLDGYVRAGVDAYILTIDGNWELLHDLGSQLSPSLQQRFIRLSPADVRQPVWVKIAFGPWQWFQLVRQIRRLNLNVVIGFMERANLMTLLSPRVRKVISIRSHYESLMGSKAPLKRWLVRSGYSCLMKRAERIVLNSSEAAASFSTRFPACRSRVAVIPNFCDGAALSRKAREELGSEDSAIFSRPVIITCGRLIPDKGHASLIRAFGKIAQCEPHSRLVILGSGPAEPSLRGLRDSLGLRGRVILPGHKGNPFSWIARATVFVLPSLREGFPNALLEAMALGMPVIASDCRSGPREILAPETDPCIKTASFERAESGFLVAPGAEDCWAQVMLEMLRDEPLRNTLGKAAARRADDFSLERSMSQWWELAA